VAGFNRVKPKIMRYARSADVGRTLSAGPRFRLRNALIAVQAANARRTTAATRRNGVATGTMTSAMAAPPITATRA
jgi:hypothetical protein